MTTGEHEIAARWRIMLSWVSATLIVGCTTSGSVLEPPDAGEEFCTPDVLDVGAEADVLVDYALVSAELCVGDMPCFTRGSRASLWAQNARCYQVFAQNELRLFADGSAYLEGDGTNLIMSQALDTARGAVTPGAGWASLPDGWGNENNIVSLGDAGTPPDAWSVQMEDGDSLTTVVSQSPSGDHTFSYLGSGPALELTFRVEGLQLPETSTVVRRSFTRRTSTAPDSIALLNNTGSLAQHTLFGLQVERRAFATQFVPDVQRAADALTIPENMVPADWRTGDWDVLVSPAAAAGDIAGLTMVLFDFGDGDDTHTIRLDGSGGNAKFCAVECTVSLAWDADEALRLQILHSAGEGRVLRLDGSQIGSFSLPSEAPTAGSVRVGARKTGIDPYFGRLGRPRRMP